MKNLFYPFLLSATLLFASCGNGNIEKVTADSSVTSSSVTSVALPATINTDTTTAVPVALNDSSSKKAILVKKNKPIPKKVVKKIKPKPGKDKKHLAAKGKPAPKKGNN